MTLYYAVPIAGMTPTLLLGWAVMAILKGRLVPRSWVAERIADRDLVIAEKNAIIAEQSEHIAIVERNNELLRLGNQTTLQVVAALPSVAAVPDQAAEGVS